MGSVITDWDSAYNWVRNSLQRGEKFLVEVGMGAGEFLFWVAENSSFNPVGSDIKKKRVQKAIKRLSLLDRNSAILLGDGKRVVRDLFPSGSISKIVINYPDPWPKKHQRWRRISFPFFVDLIADRLEVGGVLHLSTDHLPLLEEFYAALMARSCFLPIPSKPQSNIFRGMITRYETQWILEERDLYQWSFLKKKEFAKIPEWEKVDTIYFSITPEKIPVHGRAVFIDNWIVKIVYKKEEEFRLLLVEKESKISYNILLVKGVTGDLTVGNKNEFVYSSEIQRVLMEFFGGNWK